METNHFALYTGKIVFVPDVPEEPTLCSKFQGSYDGMRVMNCMFPETNNCPCGMSWFTYRQAIQSGIASGIEVENEKEVRQAIANTDIVGVFWINHKLYPLQCRVELITELFYTFRDQEQKWVEENEWNKDVDLPRRKVARVTFEQPEKKNTRKSPEYHHARKQHFIDDYAKRREYMNMEDSLSNLYDKYCVPCELPALKQPEAAGQEQDTQADKFQREQFEIQQNIHYWAGRLIGHHQAYDIAEEIVDAINYAKQQKP